MGSVNNPNPKVDKTVRIFDGFYQYETEVDANDYDVVNSYFESVLGTDQAAANFTVALFRIADETGTSVLTLLDSIQDLGKIELTQTMCYYLNGLRSPTTLLGITSTSTPVFWAARNVMP
jgi:hypothetical protein